MHKGCVLVSPCLSLARLRLCEIVEVCEGMRCVRLWGMCEEVRCARDVWTECVGVCGWVLCVWGDEWGVWEMGKEMWEERRREETVFRAAAEAAAAM